MVSIGENLRAERERLGLTQEALADAVGVTTKTQGMYERDQRSPNAEYLAALANAGADVLYVITGQRTPVRPEMGPIEWLFIDRPGSSLADERANFIGYDLKNRQPLLLAAISNDPDVELCIAGDQEPVAIRDGAAYV